MKRKNKNKGELEAKLDMRQNTFINSGRMKHTVWSASTLQDREEPSI